MTVELQEEIGSGAITVRVSGKLQKEDYEIFVPEIERMIDQHGKISILLDLHEFHGWDAGALWEDIKFDVKHFNDIERLAIVGESKWQKGMATFCKPFTTAEIEFFEREDIGRARRWINLPERIERESRRA